MSCHSSFRHLASGTANGTVEYTDCETLATNHHGGVRVRVMIGDVAHVTLVFKGHCEGSREVDLSSDAASRLRTSNEVVFVVADF